MRKSDKTSALMLETGTYADILP